MRRGAGPLALRTARAYARPIGSGPAIVIRDATTDDEPAIIDLLAASLGWVPDEHHRAFFAWKHQQSPFGPSPAWVALVDGEIAGFRTFLRWEFEGDDRAVRAVRAVDTATRPDVRGHGVFRRLTLHALDGLAGDGVDFVFNTPNDQSRPGYVKMGWCEIGQVVVQVRARSPWALATMARSRQASELWSIPCDVGVPAATAFEDQPAIAELLASQPRSERLQTRRSVEYLRWRYGFEPLRYRALLVGPSVADGLAVFRLRRRGQARECVLAEILVPGDEAGRASRLARSALWASGATHALATRGRRLSGFLASRRLGPVLTSRAVGTRASPPPTLDGWDLALGDIELF